VRTQINIHQSGVACLQYNGRFIVSGSTDNSARIYDVGREVEVACLQGHNGLIRSVQAVFDEDDNGAEVMMVVSGSYDGSVRLWEQVPGSSGLEWRTRHQFHLGDFFQAHGDLLRADGEANKRIFSLAFDADRFVCAGQGPVIRVWDLQPPSE
jgi:WD40 repeat protein